MVERDWQHCSFVTFFSNSGMTLRLEMAMKFSKDKSKGR